MESIREFICKVISFFDNHVFKEDEIVLNSYSDNCFISSSDLIKSFLENNKRK